MYISPRINKESVLANLARDPQEVDDPRELSLSVMDTRILIAQNFAGCFSLTPEEHKYLDRRVEEYLTRHDELIIELAKAELVMSLDKRIEKHLTRYQELLTESARDNNLEPAMSQESYLTP